MNIAIISASVRISRGSHRVALFFENYIETRKLAVVDLLDLKEYKFPFFEERLRNINAPTEATMEFAHKIVKADGVIIVTPEYNGGYPASLKNVIDLLYAEWKRKPVALATVSNGSFGGTQVMTSLVFTLWKIGVWVVPAMFPVPKVQLMYDENGMPADKEAAEKRAKIFIDELFFCIDARQRMQTSMLTR
jgi:NAD(P)H-dependent FMN reductase